MSFLFNEIVYNPLYNLLIGIYNIAPLHDFGIAIILVTILIKLLLIPLSKKQIESQRKMQILQPKIKEIQTKYKTDKEKQSRALMELYKENKTNPFSGCLPMVVQIVFLIAIYQVLFNISKNSLIVDDSILYSFVTNPGQINHLFLGVLNLSATIDLKNLDLSGIIHVLIVVLAAISQFIQAKMLMAKQVVKPKKEGEEPDFSQIMMKQMLFLGPLMTLLIGIKFPAGLALYWLVSTVFMIGQQYYIQKKQSAIVATVKE
jgi:YidC/Oxa1 family membrane protein insertase